MRSLIPFIVAIALTLSAGCFGPHQTARSKSFEAELTKICFDANADIGKTGRLSDSTVRSIEGVMNSYSEFSDSVTFEALKNALRANSKLANPRSEKMAATLKQMLSDEFTSDIPTLVRYHLAHVSASRYSPSRPASGG